MSTTDQDPSVLGETIPKEITEPKPPATKRRGRPPKNAVTSKKRGSRGITGRPKGDAAVINEYKARMLASPKSVKVLETIFDAALDNDHKNQSAAWKLLMDRMLPVAAFEKEVNSGASRNAISINISGVTAGVSIGQSNDEDSVVEGDYTEFTSDDS